MIEEEAMDGADAVSGLLQLALVSLVFVGVPLAALFLIVWLSRRR